MLALGTEVAFGGEVQEQRGSDLVNASGYVLFGLNAAGAIASLALWHWDADVSTFVYGTTSWLGFGLVGSLGI